MANEKRLDLINKWDVVNKLIQIENNYNFYKDVWDAQTLYRRICELEIGIGKTPTVDAVEVVHGRWIPTYKVDIRMGISEIDGYICSECGRGSIVKENYCPNCGTNMDGKREDGVGDV